MESYYAVSCFCRRRTLVKKTSNVDELLEPVEAEVCGSFSRTSNEQLTHYRDIGKIAE